MNRYSIFYPTGAENLLDVLQKIDNVIFKGKEREGPMRGRFLDLDIYRDIYTQVPIYNYSN